MPRPQKQEGRKHARQIGDKVETDGRNEWKQKGYVAIRVPNPRRKFGAEFQQKGPYQTWDVIVLVKAFVIQYKRRKKYMTSKEKEIHKKSCKLWPQSELIPMMGWRDLGIHHEEL